MILNNSGPTIFWEVWGKFEATRLQVAAVILRRAEVQRVRQNSHKSVFKLLKVHLRTKTWLSDEDAHTVAVGWYTRVPLPSHRRAVPAACPAAAAGELPGAASGTEPSAHPGPGIQRLTCRSYQTPPSAGRCSGCGHRPPSSWNMTLRHPQTQRGIWIWIWSDWQKTG